MRDVEATVDLDKFTMAQVESNAVRCPDADAAEQMYDGNFSWHKGFLLPSRYIGLPPSTSLFSYLSQIHDYSLNREGGVGIKNSGWKYCCVRTK